MSLIRKELCQRTVHLGCAVSGDGVGEDCSRLGRGGAGVHGLGAVGVAAPEREAEGFGSAANFGGARRRRGAPAARGQDQDGQDPDGAARPVASVGCRRASNGSAGSTGGTTSSDMGTE